MSDSNKIKATTAESSVKPASCEECQKCFELLQLIVDGEASPEQKLFFDTHIDDCVECLDCYKQDLSLRQTLREKVSKKQVPQDLVDCIRDKIGTKLL